MQNIVLHHRRQLALSMSFDKEGEEDDDMKNMDEDEDAPENGETQAPGIGSEEGDGDEEEDEEEEIPEEEMSETERAVKAEEERLTQELKSLEDKLRAERRELIKVKDKISESGKTGFFMVQAQVSEFLKRKDKEQKSRVENNKRDFVQRMLPIIDMFREARAMAPPEEGNERQENMHATFGSLLDSILIVFEKYGYREFTPDEGSTLRPLEHEVLELEEVDNDRDGQVLRVVRAGIRNENDDTIYRRACVIGGRKLGASRSDCDNSQGEMKEDEDEDENEDECVDGDEGEEETEDEEGEEE